MVSTDLRIAGVVAWEALDSRGTPTVACRVSLDGGGVGRAVVPSGKSVSRHEAAETRDGEGRFGGMGVRRAVEAVHSQLAPAIVGLEASAADEIDARLARARDGEDGPAVGSNATLAVSLASMLAAANGLRTAPWRLIGSSPSPRLPMPMIQILGGGAHAGGVIDLQDVLAIPVGAASFAEAIEFVARVRDTAHRIVADKGPAVHLVADEGGLALSFTSNRAAVEFVALAIEAAGLAGRAAIAIDVAASQLLGPDGRYHLASEGRTLDRDEWVAEVRSWTRSLPIVSIEDPLDEDDWAGWAVATTTFAGVQVIGDDLLATDASRLGRAVHEGAANAVLVKPNQRGTLSEARSVLERARAAGYRTIVSGRSGDTEDHWLADLAIGWDAGQIKVGSLTRSERVAKWNRLLEIEATEADATLANPFAL